MCFFVLCNRHWFNGIPGPPPRDGLGVTYLHFAFSSDDGYVHSHIYLRIQGAQVQYYDWVGCDVRRESGGHVL